MKILFMGTPDIAATSLAHLIKKGFSVVGVVTQPDKPRGRKQVLTPPEVKVLAMENNLPVFQPESLKNGELLPILEELKPDIIAVVAYGKILPEYILSFPKYGCINMHASLLPKLRGAAPIQWSVINGDEVTGVTTMKMDKGLDTGDMLLTEEIKIGEYETSGELFERIATLGADVLVRTIENIKSITPIPQNDEESTYAPIIKKEMAKIDWSMDKKKISKLICGMNPWPVCYTEYNGENIKIYKATYDDKVSEKAYGEILDFDKEKGLGVSARCGTVYIKTIQAPGKKPMEIGEFLRGNTLCGKFDF